MPVRALFLAASALATELPRFCSSLTSREARETGAIVREVARESKSFCMKSAILVSVEDASDRYIMNDKIKG